ncbi:MAG TPA: class I SAM-dependent methyltransferase [Candidatus Limnocylindrales bacterium]|nr:class I SAM-dependent methyltransferase [Candidatus Limnocylindrales bacterium]
MMASRSGWAALGSLPTSRRQQGMLRISAHIRAKDCVRSPGNWKSVLGARARSASPGVRASAFPNNSTGAELGVFTGLFSAVLSRQRKLSKVTFVDPWWTVYGERYPDWGSYTDFGRVRTRQAFETAKRRISGFQNRFVEVMSSYKWLESQPDESLDWIYLDSTHTYDGTKQELKLINRKIRKTGLICGDDWQSDRNHRHHGVFLAVNEFIREEDFEFVLCGVNSQWIIRRGP